MMYKRVSIDDSLFAMTKKWLETIIAAAVNDAVRNMK